MAGCGTGERRETAGMMRAFEFVPAPGSTVLKPKIAGK
jgi:hypothetical protein